MDPHADPETEYLWVHEAQDRLRLGETKVRQLFDAGVLEGFRIPGSGYRRITAESVERLSAEMHGPRAPEHECVDVGGYICDHCGKEMPPEGDPYERDVSDDS